MTKNLEVEQMSWGNRKSRVAKKYEDLPWFGNWRISGWVVKSLLEYGDIDHAYDVMERKT